MLPNKSIEKFFSPLRKTVLFFGTTFYSNKQKMVNINLEYAKKSSTFDL